MDIRSKFSFNIPEALIEALGITEDEARDIMTKAKAGC